MKKTVILILTVVLLASCQWYKNNQDDDYSAYKPVLMDKTDFLNAVSMYQAQPLDTVGQIRKIGDYLLVMELYKGIHVLRASDLSNLSFVVIPGIIDFYVKDSCIYANSATDLLTLRFNNYNDIELKDRQPSVFYELLPPDGRPGNPVFMQGNRPENTVIVGWQADPNIGLADSAVFPYYLFAGYQNYLYTSLGSNILSFDISQGIPVYKATFKGNYNFIDKVYVFGDHLYTLSLGSMAVFYLSPAEDPVFVTQYTGINSGTYMSVYDGTDILLFVSFHYSLDYQTFNNVVQVYNLGQFTQVVLDTAIAAQNPYDILLSDSTFFVCDEGIKTYRFKDGKLYYASSVPGEAYNIFKFDSLLVSLGPNDITCYRVNDTSLVPSATTAINYAWAIRF